MPPVDEPNEDELEIELRPRQAIAARMVILAAVVRRAVIELPGSAVPDDEDSPQGWQFDALAALQDEPLASSLTDQERRFMSAPIGSLAEDDVLAAAWQSEALAALAALTLPNRSLAETWRQVDAGALLAAIPEPLDDLRPFAAALALPTDEEAAFERERAELWAWRAAIDDDLQRLTGRRLAELRAVLAETVDEAAAAGLLPDARSDFSVDGRPFAAVDAETKALIAEVAVQRLTALNWLCGMGDSWDTIPLDL